MNLADHPIQQIMQLVQYMDNATLHFSEYSYLPQELLDERKVFQVKASVLSEKWLEEQIRDLPENTELAFHSLVVVERKSLHLPMIDFCAPLEEFIQAKSTVTKLLPSYINSSLKFYSSGRSVHAYGSTLLKPIDWRNFMGRLLLANYPDKKPIVDARWIGHRMIAGYSTLRLSCNSSAYLGYPELIR